MKANTRCWTSAFVAVGLFFAGSSSNGIRAGRDDVIDAEIVTIDSRILGEGRVLRISVPDSYETAQNKNTQYKYPVLYLLDGSDTHFSEAAHGIENLSSLGRLPEMIVVGVKNTDRWRDMLPVKLKRHPTAGGADEFFNFLNNEVIPFVDDNYRTSPVRILFGRSNSALLTLFAMTEEGNAFDACIAASPSLGHCRGYMFERTTTFLDGYSGPDRWLFVSNGGLDGAVRLMAPIPEFINLLEGNTPEGLHWEYRYYDDEGHAPSPTLEDGLIWFFQRLQATMFHRPDTRALGLTPMRFAPGLISTEEYSETGCAITPGWKEFYFTRSGGGLRYPTTFVSRFEDDNWTRPEEAPFAGFGPGISPDGKIMFVSEYRSDKEGERTVGLWFADRDQEGWCDFEYHGLGSRPSISDNYNLYYVDRSDEKDRGVIVTRKLVDGKYGKPEIVGGDVNTAHYDAHPCIAEDEDYIIFDSDRPGGYGEGDLYICFRNDDDTWGDAINLGPAINKESHEAYASVSPDGKHLFFSSDRGGSFDLYRVDLDIIWKAKP